ncbi:MAG: hypothetical protein IKS78_00205, partial [Clostridia bacterium]|nr:hypothetical protein [Clostridia bacterium]
MAQPEVLDYLEYGEEGKHYHVENGLRILNSDYDGPDRFVSTNANIDLFVMVTQTRRDSVSPEAMAATYCPIGYEYLMEQIIANNANKTYIHNYRFTTPIESQAKYGEELRAMFQAISAQVITCPEEEFDELYDSLVAEYVAAGLEEIHEEKAAVYDAEN